MGNNDLNLIWCLIDWETGWLELVFDNEIKIKFSRILFIRLVIKNFLLDFIIIAYKISNI